MPIRRISGPNKSKPTPEKPTPDKPTSEMTSPEKSSPEKSTTGSTAVPENTTGGEPTAPSPEPSDPNRNPDGSYKVGKNQTPKHSRWKKGQSGNPSGRKKAPSDLESAVVEFMETLINITGSNGAKKRMSHASVLMRKMYEKALKGDVRPAKFLFDMYAKAKARKSAAGDASGGLTSAEQEMLRALFKGVDTDEPEGEPA